ncbi:MAG: T9SS type A sorting domain-containing protein, partial [Bacteroidota bacterium]|nr:T9SS type A sorting domain-containing protein [Bacteroidota bacterium]
PLDFSQTFVKTSLFIGLLLITSNILAQKSYYVGLNGNDSNNGMSLNSPFRTITKAVSVVAGGDTVFVRGGTYEYTTTIKFSQSGDANHLISLKVYPGDQRPVLDFSGMAVNSTNRGVSLTGSYWYIKGIRIKGAGDNGMNISGGAYNTIEFCDFYENRDGGCQLGGGAHDNKIINCDSYWNADYGTGTTTNGGNADGFSPKLDVGNGNYFYGCRSYYNSDDGWDGYMKTTADITTTIENCWTWHNGYLKDGVTTTSEMNGNGFKMGGDYLVHNCVLKNCLSFYNKAKGFDQNHNKGSMTLYNCTAIANGGNNFSISEALDPGKVVTVKNCLSYEKSKVSLLSSAIVATNSWDSQFNVTSSDFLSIDTTGISGPRKADGSLPDIRFMHLASGSKLIDAGIDVGLPYIGTKPDLGCFEFPSTNTGISSLLLDDEIKIENYPNPFHSKTTIRFYLPEPSDIKVSLFDINSHRMGIIAKGLYSQGIHELEFHTGLKAGIYFCNMEVKGEVYSKVFIIR